MKDTNIYLEEALLGKKKVAWLNILESNIYYSIKSLPFLLASLGTVFVIIAGAFSDILKAFKSQELLENGLHIKLLQKSLESDVFVFAITILCVLPYTTAYMDDLKSGFVKLYMIRANRRNYLLSKMLACMLSGGLALVVGILLSLAIFALVFTPMELAGAEEWLMPLLEKMLRIFVLGAMWSMAGMAAAAFTSSKYMAYAAPFIFYYILIIFCERYFKDCYVLYPKEWLILDRFPYGSAGVLIFLIEITILICSVFYLHEERRLGGL